MDFQIEVCMKKSLLLIFLGLLMSFWLNPALARGKLEGPIRISSEELGYDLQYWITCLKRSGNPFRSSTSRTARFTWARDKWPNCS